MNPDDLSDEELDLMIRKGKYHAPRTPGGQKPTADTISDEELDALVAKAGGAPSAAPPRPPAYQPTDYAAEANKLPPTSNADMEAEADRTANPFTRFMHRALPDSRPGPGGTPRYDDPVAHDPTAQMVLAGVLGGGAGSLAAPLGGVAAGAINGATQGVVSGGHAPDILAAAAMGGLLGGPGRAAHEPLTQQEIDAATLARAPKEPPGLPEGEHGTVELASRADQALRERLAAREKASGAAMDEADQDFSALDQEHGPVGTFGAQDRLQQVRRQSMGGNAPTLASDPMLGRYVDNLSAADGASEVPRATLRNLQKGMNNEADFGAESRDPLAQGALKQGAGVLSDRVRTADPREGPGSIGGALDRYGAEADRLREADRLLGPESGSTAKLARTGSPDRDSAPGAIEADRDIASLQDEEPAADELINAIRARNTAERRKLSLSLPYPGAPKTGIARLALRNLDNLRFKLSPPKIDGNGMVAASPAGHFDQAIPLELQLLLERDRNHESP